MVFQQRGVKRTAWSGNQLATRTLGATGPSQLLGMEQRPLRCKLYGCRHTNHTSERLLSSCTSCFCTKLCLLVGRSMFATSLRLQALPNSVKCSTPKPSIKMVYPINIQKTKMYRLILPVLGWRGTRQFWLGWVGRFGRFGQGCV